MYFRLFDDGHYMKVLGKIGEKMIKIYKKSLTDGLIVHPYETDPDYFSKINFFYFSDDKKLAAAYWVAAPGIFHYTYDSFTEVNNMLEGKMRIRTKGIEETFEKGDIFIFKNGESVEFEIISQVLSLLFIYPISANEFEDIKKMIENNKK